ncbi:MAG: M20/M25/M40 family metallo-hydrolase [Candidatus Pacebacteria bacterium]|nr:M20/M25/M40 family metallo-hydrolase [Candidatus Paceibacterota bacterium]
MQKKIIKLTRKLVEFKTISENPDELKRVVDFIQKRYKDKNVFIRRYEKNRKPSLVVTFQKTKKPKIFLNGHLDVVNAPDRDFIVKIKGNRLYGRGTADMKGPVAIMLLAFEYFLKQEKKPSLGLLLTCDEEIGSKDGLEYLLKKEKYSAKLVINPDGGQDILNIINKSKGLLHLRIESKGKSAHGSMVWLGGNALDKLISRYTKLTKMFPKPNKKNLWKPTLNLGVLRGGEVVNKVPDHAEMFLDIRITEKENMLDILSKVKKVFLGCKVEILSKSDLFYTSEKNLYIKKYVEVLDKDLMVRPKFICEHGGLDARYFAQKNIPVIVNQPRCGNIHGENEWIDIKSMNEYYNVLVKYISEVGF